MTEKERNQIFQLIKSDDLIAFSRLENGKYSICFGRFPLLSVCYLYNSKKILKAYEKILLNIKQYDIVDEPFVLYLDFQKVAKKCLRLYINNVIVSPIEMLAILNNDTKVKKVFKHFLNDEKVVANLKYIYGNVYQQKIKINGKKISLGIKKFDYYTKHITNILLVVSICFVFLFASVWSAVAFSIGDGVVRYAKISTVNEFLNALKGDAKFLLTNDIEIENVETSNKFNGTFNANGHTITIKNAQKPLISNLTGTIKNAKIVVQNASITTENSFSFVAYENNGKIENIDIDAGTIETTQTKTEGKTTYLSIFAVKNNGYIKSCKAKANLKIVGKGTGDGFCSLIAGENYGTVSDCVAKDGSQIETESVDACGIASQNYGEVSSCKNYANIKQLSNLSGWNPSVAGVVSVNYNNISNCLNFGNMTVVCQNEQDTSNALSAFVAGICAQNNSAIVHCQSLGNVTANSKYVKLYVGGICSFSSVLQENGNVVSKPSIKSCGSSGSVYATTTEDKAFVVSGGIAGYFEGDAFVSNFTTMTAQNGNDTTKYVVGSMIGLTYAVQGFDGIYISISAIDENYYLSQSNITQSLGGFLNGSVITFNSSTSELKGISSCTTVKDIENSSAYWRAVWKNFWSICHIAFLWLMFCFCFLLQYICQ